MTEFLSNAMIVASVMLAYVAGRARTPPPSTVPLPPAPPPASPAIDNTARMLALDAPLGRAGTLAAGRMALDMALAHEEIDAIVIIVEPDEISTHIVAGARATRHAIRELLDHHDAVKPKHKFLTDACRGALEMAERPR